MAVGSRWMWWCTHQFYFVKLLNLPHGGHENVEVIKETQTYTHTHTHTKGYYCHHLQTTIIWFMLSAQELFLFCNTVDFLFIYLFIRICCHRAQPISLFSTNNTHFFVSRHTL